MGGSATRGRHHPGISFAFLQPAPKTRRPIRRSSAPGCTQIQGAHIPRTSPFQEVQARGPRHRNRGPVEPGSNNFPPPLGPDKKPEQFPNILRKAVEASLLSRWSAILTHAAQHAFAASLLDLDCAGTSSTDEDTPSISQLLSEAPPPPPPISRLPARP